MRISDWSSEVCSSDLRPNRLTCSLPITLPCAHDQRGSKRRRASRCGSSEITHSGSIEALVSDHTFSVSSRVADNTQGGGFLARVEHGNSWNLRLRGPSYSACAFFPLSPGNRTPPCAVHPAITAHSNTT